MLGLIPVILANLKYYEVMILSKAMGIDKQ